jgi:hypothetical protein
VFAFNEDQMGVPAFDPAPRNQLDESERPLRESAQRTGLYHASYRLSRISESSSTRLSQCAPNTRERIGTGKETIEPQLRPTHSDATSIVDTDDPRAADDFRRWWRQRLIKEAAEKRSHRRIPTPVAITLAGIALIGLALALRGGVPAQLNRSTVAVAANDAAKAQPVSTPADMSTMPPVGNSGAVPAAPAVDAQSGTGLQTSEPEPGQSVSGQRGRRTTSPVSSRAEPGSAADAREPPVKPASGPVKGAVGTTLPSKRLEAAIPGAAADTLNAPLPIGTPERQALQRIVQSVVASATPAEAGWVVQIGARSSEAEAKRDLKRLKTKYGSALMGSTVGLREVPVNGKSIYRVHVDGLSRNKAAALCSRVKGDGGSCTIVR